ncbi:hypothetical protein DAEQUDRAFT_770067 [Daedalea quercina L-15889]|uniref:Histone deacetylase complex subunit SAP30 Sin3 binding domain-containing protein n=1 Tax=Daedalea quercina L-15889 TaxID=1314783 RepID=A0A165L6V5_9APHY|nr:hypothetical protein DAEQUDRAFT_770067 [Daedalea quercina L-15889]
MAPPMAAAQGSGGAPALGGAANASATTSRSRPQASRKKINADDAAYHAPPSASAAGAKRTAGERADGEPRAKRKRVDASATAAAANAGGNGVNGGSVLHGARKDQANGEGKINLIDFSTLPPDAVFEYLVQYDLVPDVEPSPLTPDDPPPPSALLRPRSHARRHASTASPVPSLPITPANRPRREVPARRRSARLVEDSGVEPVVPVLADRLEVHGALAQVAQRHFREHAVKEVDTLASFMCAVKAKARMAS